MVYHLHTTTTQVTTSFGALTSDHFSQRPNFSVTTYHSSSLVFAQDLLASSSYPRMTIRLSYNNSHRPLANSKPILPLPADNPSNTPPESSHHPSPQAFVPSPPRCAKTSSPLTQSAGAPSKKPPSTANPTTAPPNPAPQRSRRTVR